MNKGSELNKTKNGKEGRGRRANPTFNGTASKEEKAQMPETRTVREHLEEDANKKSGTIRSRGRGRRERASLALATIAQAGDPDITSDFFVGSSNQTALDGNLFTHSGFRSVLYAKPPSMFKVTKATLVEFHALNGQSVSYAMLQYPPYSINPLHTHPRGFTS
ncbi:hypothetical protein IFM89_028280 [Coptis chinensis]|uniref:Cupin type-1 domain-containing protein n=1 Tax=Coptis chinensis TaxID=261450 RepID=A0A835HGF4_9MAGN|nr:hypothetical protein IFM89_028280 [Coptis chinensis]